MKLLDGVLRPGGLRLTERFMDYCDFKPKARVIDIGCGAGTTVEYLITRYGLDAVGVDLSHAALRQGKKRSPGLNLIQASAESLPFANAAFSGVLAECSLSVMEYAGGVLAEINRVLAAGGKLAVSDLYLRRGSGSVSGPLSLKAKNCVSGARTYQELKQVMENKGFKIIIWEDHSEYLKEFAARYIMEYGSLEGFWQCAPRTDDNHQAPRPPLRKSELGYFLLIAEKTGRIPED
ncbi:MAG: DVU_1556 family methyltransferase [Peptococcaceae bacterium]